MEQGLEGWPAHVSARGLLLLFGGAEGRRGTGDAFVFQMGESTKNVLEVLGNSKMSFNLKKEISGLAGRSVLWDSIGGA